MCRNALRREPVSSRRAARLFLLGLAFLRCLPKGGFLLFVRFLDARLLLAQSLFEVFLGVRRYGRAEVTRAGVKPYVDSDGVIDDIFLRVVGAL